MSKVVKSGVPSARTPGASVCPACAGDQTWPLGDGRLECQRCHKRWSWRTVTKKGDWIREAAEAFLGVGKTGGVAKSPSMSAASYARICRRFRRYICSIEHVSVTRFSVRAISDERRRQRFVAFRISIPLKRLRVHKLTRHQIVTLRATAIGVIRVHGRCIFMTQVSRSVVIAFPKGLRRVKASPALPRHYALGTLKAAGAYVVSHISRYKSVSARTFPHYLSEAIWRYNSRHVPRAVLVKALVAAIDPPA